MWGFLAWTYKLVDYASRLFVSFIFEDNAGLVIPAGMNIHRRRLAVVALEVRVVRFPVLHRVKHSSKLRRGDAPLLLLQVKQIYLISLSLKY